MVGTRFRATVSWLVPLVWAVSATGGSSAQPHTGGQAASGTMPSGSASSRPSEPTRLKATLVELHSFKGQGRASQGLALTERFYYGSNDTSLCKFDTRWRLIEEKPIQIEGVNHLGAIDCHDGYIWGGLLHGPENGKYDPALNRSIIAKIRESDLGVEKTWDITRDVKWIDPVCFDGRWLWVGDMSDLGIHRYRINGGELVRDGVFRYPREMGFSQGVRIVAGRLYTIHTFGTMSGLFEFDLPERLSEDVQQPRRVWDIKVSSGHLEGFDFVPGHPDTVWHAQGGEVGRFVLEGKAKQKN